jgi:hypothetical protein
MSNRKMLVALVVVLMGAACGGGDDRVVVTGQLGNNFFVEWQLASDSFGTLVSCSTAGATTVQTSVLQIETGVFTQEVFNCDDHQALTTFLFDSPATYDVTLELFSGFGDTLGLVSLEPVIADFDGTVDLGLQTFFVF